MFCPKEGNYWEVRVGQIVGMRDGIFHGVRKGRELIALRCLLINMTNIMNMGNNVHRSNLLERVYVVRKRRDLVSINI